MAKQKTSRKAFATTAAAVMAATAVTPVAAFAASKTSFPDVPAGEYADAINNLAGQGILNGFDDGTFKPNDPVLREQAAKILATALKLDTTGTENYPDVSPDNWSYKYIVAVTKAGIFGGDEKGNFNPFANLTRQEAAKIIVQAFGFTGSTELTFGDKANIQSWAVPYVKTAVANGILKGDDQGNFNPNANIKRGDFALMIQRALNAVENAKTPKVESVSAINAKQIQITFNKPVDSLTALNKANYTVQTNTDQNPVALGNKDANAQLDLSNDGKTLTITTSSDINNAFKTANSAIVPGTPFKFTVDGVKAQDGTALEKKTFIVSSKDETAPSFLTASAKAKTTTTQVTLSFNEPVDVNGAIAYVGGQAATVAAGPTPTTVTLTTAQALEAGKEYDLTLLNFKDFAGNFLDKNPTNTKFTVTSDTVAPVVQDVKVVRDNLVEVTFDKAMDVSTFTANSRILDVNGVPQGGALIATIKGGTAGKTVRLATSSSVPFNENGTFVGTLVLGNGIKDATGNAKTATSHSVTFTKDTVKPTVVGASYVAAGAQYAGNTYPNGAIVVKFSEEVSAANTSAFKLISSTGEEVTTPAISSVAVNSLDAKEVILTMNSALPVDTYTVRVANEAVTDLSTQANKNVAAVTSVKVDGSSDTEKPTVTYKSVTAASDQTTGTKIGLNMKDNVGLDLASVQNVTNYLLDGKPLPAGSYVTISHNKPSSSAAATDIDVTLNIPEKSVVKDGDYTLNVNNIKDKAGNVAVPFVQYKVALKDDVSPELKAASISSNGLLVLTFSEAVNAAVQPADEGTAGTIADFQFTINGIDVKAANNKNIATLEDGTGTDEGKYVVKFKAVVDKGADGNADTTVDNRLFLDVDGDGEYTNKDILLQTGTTKAVGPVSVLDINMFSALKVKVVDNATVKDKSANKNPIKKDTVITVK